MQHNDQEQNTQCNKITKNKTHNATKLPRTKHTMQQNDKEQNTQCNKITIYKKHNATK